MILLAPIWLVEYPPLLDYPNHLASSFVLAHLHDPRFKFSEIYSADWAPYPYLSMYVILLGLQRIAPAEWAGRIFLSVCLLALPLAVWFFVRRANPGHDLLALWSLPFSYNTFMMLGYLSYYLSIAVCFAALGLWLWYLDRPNLGRLISLAVVFTLLYLTHAVGFALAVFVVTLHALLTRRVRQIILLPLVFLPSVILFLSAQPSGAVTRYVLYLSLRQKVGWLVGILRSGYSRQEDMIVFALLAICVVVAWWRNVDFRWNWDWLGVSAGLFAAYWILPYEYGAVSDLDVRVLPILYLGILAVARVGHRTRWLAITAVLAFVIRTGELVYHFGAEQPRLTSLARSFETIPTNARVLPMAEASPNAITHFWAYGLIRQGWLSPYLGTILAVEPLRLHDVSYRPAGPGPIKYDAPPDWTRVRRSYDYVWAYNVPQFSHELAAIGQLVFSEERLEVYHLRKLSGRVP